MYINFFLVLRQEQRLRVFEKEQYLNVREEKIGGTKKLHNEKLHDLLFT